MSGRPSEIGSYGDMPLATSLVAGPTDPPVRDNTVGDLPREAALVRPVAGASPDKQALFSYARELLAPIKSPQRSFAVDDFPLTGSGTIQKYKLREQWVVGDHTEL